MSNFIPMLSSSPPPLEDNGSIDEDDDDFGDFASASKVLDSPLDSPVKTFKPLEEVAPLQLDNQDDFEGVEKAESETFQLKFSVDILENGHNVEVFDKGSCSELCNGDDEDQDERLEHIIPEENGVITKSDDAALRTVSFCIEPVQNFSDEEEDDETLMQRCSPTIKYDNISQESVSDSGLCSGSQWSDTSPVPINELAFSSDVSPDDDLFKKDLDGSIEPTNEDVCLANELIHEPVNSEVTRSLSSSPVTESVVLNVSEPVASEHEEFRQRTPSFDGEDDFADFASAFDATAEPCFPNKMSSVLSEESLNPPKSPTLEDSFADFGDITGNEFPDDEQWAKFESGAQEVAEESSSSAQDFESQSSSSLGPSIALQRLVSAFPLLTPTEELPVDSITPNLIGTVTSSSHNVWTLLEDLDQSLSLRYQWAGSETFQKILHSLNIDSRNILRNPSVPVFALGLGILLEPVKVDSEPSAEDNADKQPSPGLQEEYIPPAQFDWTSSGLVNPLDPNQVSSTLLDLDFFATAITPSSSKSVTKTFSLEEELLGREMGGAANEHQSDSSSQQNVILEKLLSSMKEAQCTLPRLQQQRPDNLSKSSVKILDSVPDLSFIRAKVLMFPVRSQSGI